MLAVQESLMAGAFSAGALASNVGGATLAVLFFFVFGPSPALAQHRHDNWTSGEGQYAYDNPAV